MDNSVRFSHVLNDLPHDATINTKLVEVTNTRQECEEKCFVFTPQLYVQRYQYVSKLLEKYDCKSFMDIGCAECKLLRHVRLFNTHVNLILGVDIDENLLLSSRFLVQPFNLEYIRKRENPLEIYLIKGDISETPRAFMDKISRGSLDCISLIEVIEHMYPDCLEKCIDLVFGILQPKMVIMSTPNSEFNVVFEHDEKHPVKKFRHWDHKFEWSRNEFETWSKEILNKYEHVYETCFFDGLGEPPVSQKHIGMCTQIVVFLKKSEIAHSSESHASFLQSYLDDLYSTPFDIKKQLFYNDDFGTYDNYKLIDCIQYPHQIIDYSKMTVEEKTSLILGQIGWLLTFIIGRHNEYSEITLNDEELKECHENDINTDAAYSNEIKLVRIEDLMAYESIKRLKFDLNDVKQAIQFDNQYELTKSGNYLILKTGEGLSRYGDTSSETYSSDQDNTNSNFHAAPTVYENWSDEEEKPRFTSNDNDELVNWGQPKETQIETILNNSMTEMNERRRKFYNDENSQFIDAESTPSSSNYSLSSCTSKTTDNDWTKAENNYYVLESKKFAQKLWNIKQKNIEELRNYKFDSNQFECPDD